MKNASKSQHFGYLVLKVLVGKHPLDTEKEGWFILKLSSYMAFLHFLANKVHFEYLTWELNNRTLNTPRFLITNYLCNRSQLLLALQLMF